MERGGASRQPHSPQSRAPREIGVKEERQAHFARQAKAKQPPIKDPPATSPRRQTLQGPRCSRAAPTAAAQAHPQSSALQPCLPISPGCPSCSGCTPEKPCGEPCKTEPFFFCPFHSACGRPITLRGASLQAGDTHRKHDCSRCKAMKRQRAAPLDKPNLATPQAQPKHIPAQPSNPPGQPSDPAPQPVAISDLMFQRSPVASTGTALYIAS